jgi:hypothetical protein
MPKKKKNVDATPAFVFRGTVRKLRAATMKEVPLSDRTAIVRVEKMIESPKGFRHYEGIDIAVELAGRKKIAAGDELIVHANSWMFGDSVALRAVTFERVTAKHAVLLAEGGDPEVRQEQRKLQEHIATADLVVSGKVVAVTIPPEAPALLAAAAPVRPVSEHDPKWRQAVIVIDQTHKGTHESRQVTLLFPASMDVRWYRAPKFEAGQTGLFLLHKTTIPIAEHHELRGLLLAPADTEVGVYTALHPEDVQPLNQQAAIAAMIR